MAQNWLVAVDDSVWASYAFNYAAEFMNRGNGDHLYLMHVMEEPGHVFMGYANAHLIESMQKLEDEKARKILVHYGHKAKALGVRTPRRDSMSCPRHPSDSRRCLTSR